MGRREHSLSENLTKTQNFRLSIDSQSKRVFKESKRGQVEIERVGREKRSKSGGEKEKKKGWPYRHLQPLADNQALQDISLGLQRMEDWSSDQPELKFKFSAKRRCSVSNLQLRLRPFNQIPASRTGGQEKIE